MSDRRGNDGGSKGDADDAAGAAGSGRPTEPATLGAGARTLRFVRGNARQLGELLVAGLLSNVFVLLLPLFSMILYDRVVGNRVHDTLIALSLGMALAVVLDLFLRIVRVHFVEHAGARWDMRLDRHLLHGVTRAPADRPIQPGVLLSRYKQVAMSREFLSSGYLLPLADLPFLILFVFVLWTIGGSLVIVPLVEAAESREVLRGQRRESRLAQRFEALSHVTAMAGARSRFWSGLAQQLMPVLITASAVAVLVVGVFRVEDQVMTVGALTAASLVSTRIVVFMASVASIFARLKEFGQAMRDLDGLLATEALPESAWSEDAAQSAPKVVVSRLSFAYEAQQPCLSDLELTIEPGSFVALVGRAGSGKSTLLRALSGSLVPAAGKLSVGARVIASDEDRHWLARCVAAKAQEAAFNRGTFAQTVQEWAPDAGDEAVQHALRESGFADALDRALLGINSVVAAGGLNLSGGQRQMLAMARVFASGRTLMLLDEPTAGLDATSEQAILSALRARRGKVTAVIATHSPDVIALSDRVIVMDRGRIAADLPPSALADGGQRGAAVQARPPKPVAPVSGVA